MIGLGCAPENDASDPADPSAVIGEFVTYVADFDDGHEEWWHALRKADGKEVRLDFDTPPGVATGTPVRIHGDASGERLHVRALDVLPRHPIGLAASEPDTYAAPATDTYALVLVDLGNGVNVTSASGQASLFNSGATDKSFANYYKEVSYGKYQVTGDVIGPFPFSMTSCDTTGMYQAIEPKITGTYNHLIYYFNQTSLCSFGGLGEEGSVSRPAKRTWMNGSLSCVVLMQEPGHNLGLMHANTMKCGSSSFSTTPASACTITEYGSGMSTMGGGCKQFNAYERLYMQWLGGCNGVRVPSTGTFNLLPLENNCTGGSGIQVLQVPFPATLPVSDPQSTSTTVNLNNYYVELRAAGGIFDTYSTSTRGTVFSGPTVFIYASDNVRAPAATGRGQNSVWTELLNMTPTGTAFTGLTTAGQSFVDPAGGPTITLQSISATGATIAVTYPNGSGSPTCMDGTALTAPGPASCSGSSTGTGGSTPAGGTSGGGGGARGTGGTVGTGGSAGRSGSSATGGSGSAGRTGSGGSSTGGSVATGTGGTNATGGATGSGGNAVATGGTTAPGAGGTSTPGAVSDGTLTGGCSCSTDPAQPGTRGLVWLSLGLGLVFVRGRRRRAQQAAEKRPRTSGLRHEGDSQFSEGDEVC